VVQIAQPRALLIVEPFGERVTPFRPVAGTAQHADVARVKSCPILPVSRRFDVFELHVAFVQEGMPAT
jgi:hypothetical protein